MFPNRFAYRYGIYGGFLGHGSRGVAEICASALDSAQDLRAHTPKILRAGAALVPVLAALADANDAEFFGDMTPKERVTLERVHRGLVARHDLKSIPITYH